MLPIFSLKKFQLDVQMVVIWAFGLICSHPMTFYASVTENVEHLAANGS